MNSGSIGKTASVTISKFLSFVLRHKPESIGLALDPQGWAFIEVLIDKSKAAGVSFTKEQLLHVVETSEKKRFSVSADGQRIRAAQGHSVPVNLGLSPQVPPTFLYHGTASRFIESILTEGIRAGARQQVHLSSDQFTAMTVGARHGKPIVLVVDASRMHAARYQFFLAENGVWLTDHVPTQFFAISSTNSTDADSAITSRHPKPSV